MREVFQFGILGLSSGALLALFALGLVVVYRGSGVVNFAHGAIGMVGTYLFWQLDAKDGWAYLPAFVVGVLACALIGLITHYFVMRPLRAAAPVTRMIATLGLLTVLEQAAVHIFSAIPRIAPSALPTGTVRIFGATIGEDKLILLGISIALVGLLSAFYRYTRFGWATTASNENRRALAALGYSSNRLAAISWALGGSIAGVAGILLAPSTGVQVTQLTLLILPGLAAAVVGNLRSFSLTLVGGLLVGVIQSEISRYVSAPGWSDTAPFILILIVLLIRGQDRGLRTQIAERLPRLGSGRVRLQFVIPAVVAALVIVHAGISDDWVEAIVTTFAVGVILLSFVAVTGYTGQLSLAQFAFAGFGAWVAGRLVAGDHMSFLLALIIGVLATVPLGILLGVICLRTRGINLAIATLGLAVTLQDLVFDNGNLTGGSTGTIVGNPKLFGIELSEITHGAAYATVCIVAFTLVALALANLRRGRSGRRLVASRANERAAASLGVNPLTARLFAFGLSSGVAALGGILISFRDPFIVYTNFETLASVELVAQAVVGGVGWIIGPLIGAVGQVGGLLTQILSPLGGEVANYLPLAFGVLLLVTITQAPDGAAELIADQLRWVYRKIVPERERPPRELSSLEQITTHRVQGRRLDVDGVSVQFGGVRVLRDVSLTVQPGEVVGLIGPNGAGKTTMIDTISGFTRPRSGDVRLDETSLVGNGPSRVARAGVARSFQSLELFDDMSVLDNLRTASEPRDNLSFLTDLVYPRKRPLSQIVQAVIAEFHLAEWLDKPPTDLPYGRRRLVAIARAVATEPSILCLDEPAAGLDEHERVELSDLLGRLSRDWGMGVLLIEHDTDLVMRTCDRIYVLNFGEQLASGTPEEIRNNPDVIAAYLGDGQGEDGQPRQLRRTTPTPTATNAAGASAAADGQRGEEGDVLVAERLTLGYNSVPAVRDLDLIVKRGEVLALIGPNGAGKSTTLLALSGELKPLAGRIVYRGSDRATPLHQRARSGLRYITEERSVFMSMTVEQNLLLGQGDPQRCFELFPELKALATRRVGLLSGGEQQMLTLGRALSGGGEFLLADELSLGLAPLVSERLLTAVRDAADGGMGVVLVEQHIKQALAVADRVCVLQRGRIVLQGTSEEMGEQLEKIESSYLAGTIS
jgi:ABC-type branched-subunit amino acid transport system ATPase component/branched-subunit amino acid ABC-type transport system permease component